MTEIDPLVARRIIDQVASSGQPPEYGLQFFTSGIEPYLSVLEKDYLSSHIRRGGSTFKLIVGVYGGGKTHFLYCVRDRAWKHNYATAYVNLNPSDTPFHRLDEVYKAIVRSLTPPLTPDELFSGYERGIENLIRHWFMQERQRLIDEGYTGDDLREEMLRISDQIEGIESQSFARAVKAAFRALLDEQRDVFEDICQWLKGEGYDRARHQPHGISQRIDKSTAFTMIRSLLRWVREIDYSGLVILFDEAERIPSMSSKQSELLLNNLRQLIDECGYAHFQGALILYAVPDESFLIGRTQTYEALRQRVSSVMDTKLNPFGVKIDLEKMTPNPVEFLTDVGIKLAAVYEAAFGPLDQAAAEQQIRTLAEKVVEERFGDTGYKRLFVQQLIPRLRSLQASED
jgi:hypothetical protein